MNPLSGNRIKVYQALRRAALEGRDCPTNAEIAEIAGYATACGAASAINVLKAHDLLDIEHFAQARDVIFPDGIRTNCRREWDAVRDRSARAFGVEPYQLCASSRKQHIVRARIACAWALKTKFPILSQPAIGMLLGGRDHSSVFYYLERAAYFRERDADFRARCDAIFHGETVVRALPAPSKRKAESEPPVAVWCEQCDSRVMGPCSWRRCGQRACA